MRSTLIPLTSRIRDEGSSGFKYSVLLSTAQIETRKPRKRTMSVLC
jgi:hypothetical protein